MQLIFFFEFKIVSFRQKECDNHEICRQYTLGSKLKIVEGIVKKKTFVDFCQIYDFWQNLGFFRNSFVGFQNRGKQ